MTEIKGLTFTGHTAPKEPKNTVPKDATFSEVLRERIGKVGLVGYAQEQREMAKYTRVLTLMRAESSPDIKHELDTVLEGFKAHPPQTKAEMERRLEDHIKSLPEDAPEKLKERMQALFMKARQLSSLSEGQIDSLTKEELTGIA